MALSDEIEKMRKEIRTDGYSMSIGEWMSLYENKEIDIHPEFQRFYRWTDFQKTKLIESILLGIPIPPIFVSQRKDGVWDVVDGLQRLSTIYQFAGTLKDENGSNIAPLNLSGTAYLPSLDGIRWNDPDNPDTSLATEQRLLIKRSKISVSILLKESDEIAKFELFERLNTGGSNLTPQEVRNCVLIMTNKDIYHWLRNLSAYDSFQECISLSEKNIYEQYDLELALRFVVFSFLNEDSLANLGDVGTFLTKKMIEIARDKTLNLKTIETSFKSTFDLLANSVNVNAFRKYSLDKKRFIGGFVLSPFEVIAYGLGYNYENPPESEKIKDLIQTMWNDETFNQWSGSGVRANQRLPRLIPYGRDNFKNEN